MRIRQAATLVLVLALAAALSGVATASLSPTAYRAAANAACAKANAEQKALGRPGTKAQIARFFARSLPIGKAEYATLARLAPPAGLAAAHAAALGYLRQEIALLEGIVGRIRLGADPLATFQRDQAQGDKLSAGETAAWKRAGVGVCAAG